MINDDVDDIIDKHGIVDLIVTNLVKAIPKGVTYEELLNALMYMVSKIIYQYKDRNATIALVTKQILDYMDEFDSAHSKKES